MLDPNAAFDVGLHRRDDAIVVSVAGEVDLFAAPALTEALEAAIAQDRPVVVDLTACTLFDSSGVHAVLSASARDGRRFAIARPPQSSPARILDLTAPGHFPAHDTRDAALAALA